MGIYFTAYLIAQNTLGNVDTHSPIIHSTWENIDAHSQMGSSGLESPMKLTQMQFIKCALVALIDTYARLAEDPFTNRFIIHSVLNMKGETHSRMSHS